ncbi:hypothetical protein PR202_gb08079 [Eleusine coracana subsp. coracana]|uniref:Fatty acyl-CoA reductase n=1 Tax=Eleusine coracana subsp. coracana TaxID=191504 RepID=A0AAV5EDY3_ELECO|nr:hypothetical protein PR202_gb08079 [Eleusine coracana subsp. coracana]
MGCSSVSLLGHPVISAKQTPTFAIAKDSRVHRSGVLLPLSLRKHNNHRGLECSSLGTSGTASSILLDDLDSRAPAASMENIGGIGIAKFLRGKNFFITGGTGFLAKVLIEKILRTDPDIGKIYVMVKAKDKETAIKRLQTEIVDTELFKCLREIHGKDFHNFVARKLIPVTGNVREANLGIERGLANEIAEVVDIIVHAAGNTNFHERAKLHGWKDTYTFTKAMGEMFINCFRGEIPVVMIRPSIIESTLREPFPGWIEGIRMVDPVILQYGKGQMRSFLGNPDCIVDFVPADMVVNAMLASMAKHGGERAAAAGMHVYHIASSMMNPLLFEDMFQFFYQHFTRSPFIDATGKPIQVKPIQFCNNMDQYIRNVEMETYTLLQDRQGAAASEGLLHRAGEKIAKYIIYLGRIFEPYTFYDGRFANTNTEALLAEMSVEERAMFQFDVRSVDWLDYFTNVHIPGFKQNVLRGSRV